ncbi:unnamed protein product [Pedinophyceae sp. YPF-701]|nr:unnamed protein product [Pedinophyceae sp. YPF-701]
MTSGAAQAPTVVCIGDPVMDLILRVSPETLAELGCAPGGCVSVEGDEMSSITARASADGAPERIPGGSSANVAKGLASLAGDSLRVRFVGMVGNDDVGTSYRSKLEAAGVDPVLLTTTGPETTARCLCLVTPDGQRTMRTHLGAALGLTSLDTLPEDWLPPGTAVLHLEGYALYKPDYSVNAMRAAKRAGALVSLDLASFETVLNCADTLKSVLEEGLVDILLANQDEAETIARAELGYNGESALPAGRKAPWEGEAVEMAMTHLLTFCDTCVVSMGPKGCVARSRGGGRGVSAACRVDAVDTTGAGDSFTAGFLHAHLMGAGLQEAAACGCSAGTASVQVAGAELPQASWAQLRQQSLEIIATAGPGRVRVPS